MKKTLMSLGLFALSIAPLMAGTDTDITTVTDTPNNLADYSSIVRYDGHTAIAYSDGPGELRLWVDDGSGTGGIADDGIKNGDEDRLIATYLGSVEYIKMIVHDNRLAIAHKHNFIGDSLHLWYDDTGVANGQVDLGELRTLLVESTGNISLMGYEGHLALSYYDDDDSALMLWIDDGAGPDENDLEMNMGEIRLIDNSASVGQDSHMTTVNGNLAISYHDSSNGNLKIWIDDGYFIN